MRQKSIFYSVVIISFLIISLFVWTASAVGDTENTIKSTHNLITDKDTTIEETDFTSESVVEDDNAEISVDDADISVGTSNDLVDISDINEGVDDTNDNDNLEGIDNSIEEAEDTTDSSENTLIDDSVNSEDEAVNEVDDTGTTVDEADNSDENSVSSVEDADNPGDSAVNSEKDSANQGVDTNSVGDDTNNSGNVADSTVDGADNSGNNDVNAVDASETTEVDTGDSEDDSINPKDDTDNSEVDTVNPGVSTNNSSDDTDSSVDESNNSVNDSTGPGADANNSGVEVVNSGDKTDDSGNNTLSPEDNTNDSGNDTLNPENDTDDSGNNTLSPEDNTNDSGNDTLNPENDTDDSGDDTLNPEDDTEESDDTKSLELTVDEPSTEFVCTRTVLFNFSASDKLDDNITYTLYVNGTERSKGSLTEGEWKQAEISLDDGYYTWEIKIEDSLGNTDSSELNELNVDTNVPTVSLISPENLIVNTGSPLNFSFTADNDFDDIYKDKDLIYEVDIDGEPIEEKGCSGTMRPGEIIQTQDITDLSDGAHFWSVYIEDEAGNNVTSDERTFYVDKEGLRVSLISPNNEHVSDLKPTFTFRVSGGKGLPFSYILLVDGKEIKKTTFDGSENRTLEVLEDSANDYSIEASVPDGEDKTWTVFITDIAGNIYKPDPYHFSLDTMDPGRVANLSVRDAPGETQWSYTHDSPSLYVSWDANAGGDLASTPYEVFISDSEPHSIEDMEKVKATSETSLLIEKYDGEPLAYGKDYWVAVIARDKLGNYNQCFVAICGPVRTYEDMDITLNPGWNMKSVPKRLLESNLSPESVFGMASTVLYWNGKSWEVPQTIKPCKGYWVYSPEVFKNNVKFKPPSSDNEFDDLTESLDLAPGWQMIGSTAMQPVTWSKTLSSLENSNSGYTFLNLITYSHNEGWSGVIPVMGVTSIIKGNGSGISSRNLTNESSSRPVGLLQNEGMMVPGQGYWVYITKEGTYSTPESDITDDNVPVDDLMNGSEANIDEGTDNATAEGGTADEAGFDDGTTDDVTTNVKTTDDGTVEEIGVDEKSIDDGTSDDGSSEDVGVDEENTGDETSDDGSSEDVGVNEENTGDETSDGGSDDEISISD